VVEDVVVKKFTFAISSPDEFLVFNAHKRNCLIYTSGLKSDVIVVFLDPDFLYDVGILAICEHITGRNWHIYVCMDFQSKHRQRDKRTDTRCDRQTELIICPMLYGML